MGSFANFESALSYGKIGETIIANYFKEKGFAILPIYEKEISEGKGPSLFFPDQEIIATDMFVFSKEKAYWIEAKHKHAFSWHRKTKKWVTGIDINHYENYIKVMKKTIWPVWLIFYHEGGQAKDSPPESPSGMYGNDLKILKDNENHRHLNWGSHGMVYWAIENLIKIN